MLVCSVRLTLSYLWTSLTPCFFNIKSLPIATFIFHVTGNAELPGKLFTSPPHLSID